MATIFFDYVELCKSCPNKVLQDDEYNNHIRSVIVKCVTGFCVKTTLSLFLKFSHGGDEK